MPHYAAPLIAVVLLAAFPTQAFGRRGLRTLSGVGTYLGHAAFAGIPGTILAWAVPGAPFEAVALLTLAGVAASGSILLPPLAAASRRRRRAEAARRAAEARGRADSPARGRIVPDHGEPPAGDLSPWLWARVSRPDPLAMQVRIVRSASPMPSSPMPTRGRDRMGRRSTPPLELSPPATPALPAPGRDPL